MRHHKQQQQGVVEVEQAQEEEHVDLSIAPGSITGKVKTAQSPDDASQAEGGAELAKGEQADKEPVIRHGHAVADHGAVVVKPVHAVAADVAVAGSRRAPQVAGGAVLFIALAGGHLAHPLPSAVLLVMPAVHFIQVPVLQPAYERIFQSLWLQSARV